MVQETMMKMGKKVKEIILEEQVNMGGGGRGRNRRNDDNEESEFGDDDDQSQHRYGRRHHRGINQEERFGKLKFTMPKFDGRSDPEDYFTWELKVEKIFCLHIIQRRRNLQWHLLSLKDML